MSPRRAARKGSKRIVESAATSRRKIKQKRREQTKGATLRFAPRRVTTMSSRAATKTATDAHGAGFSFRIELGFVHCSPHQGTFDFPLRGYFEPVKGRLTVISSIRVVMATPSAIKRAPAL